MNRRFVVIRRRFETGRRNLENVYAGLVNAWVLYDSSGEVPRVLDGSERTSNANSSEEAKVPDPAMSLPAMKRARKRAEELARVTNTALVQVVDGEMVVVRDSQAKPRG